MFHWIRKSTLRYQFVGGVYDEASRQAVQRTALQKHVDFFDKNRDGILTWREILGGLNQLETGDFVRRPIFAFLVVLLLGKRTWRVRYPTLTINVDAIHRGRHGSTTGIFKPGGEVDMERFEELFLKYDGDGDGLIEQEELARWMKENARFANWLDRKFAERELPVLFRDFAERDDRGDYGLTKDRLAKLFQGDLFTEIADENKKRREQRA